MTHTCPHLAGRVTVPHGKGIFFIPQRPYFPVGTLREQLLYPDTVSSMQSSKFSTMCHIRPSSLTGLSCRRKDRRRFTENSGPGSFVVPARTRRRLGFSERMERRLFWWRKATRLFCFIRNALWSLSQWCIDWNGSLILPLSELCRIGRVYKCCERGCRGTYVLVCEGSWNEYDLRFILYSVFATDVDY